jgi:hypothetical protein
LHGPGHANDFGPAEVDAFEAVEVRSAAGDLLFQVCRVHHHGDCLVGVETGVAIQARQTEEGFLCVCDAAFANEPPRRFGRERDADEKRYGPHPLQREWDSVCPVVVAVQHCSDHADRDQLSETPAEVDVCCEIAAEGNRAAVRMLARFSESM